MDRDIQKKLTTVCARDRSIAIPTSQSSMANCPATTRPATRRPTTMNARAGKKKLTKRAKAWRTEEPDKAGWANIVKASMTQRDEVWCCLIYKRPYIRLEVILHWVCSGFKSEEGDLLTRPGTREMD